MPTTDRIVCSDESGVCWEGVIDALHDEPWGDEDGRRARRVGLGSYLGRDAEIEAVRREAAARGLTAEVGHNDEVEIVEVDAGDPEACPGCGARPGDGRTAGCRHPYGCGFAW